MVYNMTMKRDLSTKLLSLSMVLVFAASSASCSSPKREYETIKDTDTWYECSSFNVSGFFPAEEYEYSDYESIGASDEFIYLTADLIRKFEGNFNDLSDDEMMDLYEQYILKFSYDGELIEKKEFDSVTDDGNYRALQKAWISDDGEFNILEQEFNKENSSTSYFLNGNPLILPEVNNYYNNPVYIEDIYCSGGYTVYKLYVNSWRDTLAVTRPDGSSYEIFLEGRINGQVSGIGNLIPSDGCKVMMQVYLDTGEDIYVSLDPSTGTTEELKGFYGTSGYLLEYASGKTVTRNYEGFSFLDKTTGALTPIFNYNDTNTLMCDIMDAQTLYISDDGSEIVFGCETYEESGTFMVSSGYKIMHLSRASSNPHAGKTKLTLSFNEDFFPERSYCMAIQKYNENSTSFFLNCVFPYDEKGEYKQPDADIILEYDPVYEPSDSSKFTDLTPYLDLNSSLAADTYFMNSVNAAKSGDSLYHVPLNISTSGIITASSNVADGQTGFTFGSYAEFVDNVCNGVDPMSRTKGYNMGKADYFTKLFMNMSELFICNGKVRLDNEEFRELILFVDEYGSEGSMTEEEFYKTLIDDHNAEVQETESGRRNVPEDRSGAAYGELYSFADYIGCYHKFGEGLGVYGLPSFDGRGPVIFSHEFASVSSGTLYPDECAEFVKLLLSYDIQIEMNSNPINRAALRNSAESQLAIYNSQIEIENKYGIPDLRPVPSEAVDKYIDILSSSHSGKILGGSIEQIIIEESSAYFSGGRALEDVIPVMQKRIQTVLDESK